MTDRVLKIILVPSSWLSFNCHKESIAACESKGSWSYTYTSVLKSWEHDLISLIVRLLPPHLLVRILRAAIV